jgi:proteic killer suppression protein
MATYNVMRYNQIMIKNILCKETKKIWDGVWSSKLPQDIQEVARRKLRMLNNANMLDDLRIPPNNRLEKLIGNRLGQYSIRINQQWRICFKWQEGIVLDVEIVDYH